MATKHDRARAFPRAVEEALCAGYPGFSELADGDRWALAWLVCSAYQRKRYEHRVHVGAIMLTYQSRDALFGRGRFQKINALLNVFEVIEVWRTGENGFTKGYKLSPEVIRVMESVPIQETAMIDSRGSQLKAPARFAILSKDTRDNPRKGSGNLPAVVPINSGSVFSLMDEARQWRWAMIEGSDLPKTRQLEKRLSEMARDGDRLTWLSHHLLVPATLLMLRSDIKIIPKNHVEVLYKEYPTGRLFSIGGVLQNAPRELRAAAFSDGFEYDIANCHFSLLSQLANRAGEATPAIDDYLLNKREIRESLSSDIGIPVSGVKEALLSMVYGSRRMTQSYWDDGREIVPAIVAAVSGSEEKAKKLIAHPLFDGLHSEVRRIRNPVFDSMDKNRNRLVSPFGKTIALDESPARKLAHVVQGAEALVLDAILQECGPDLRLLLHDGFIAGVRLDCEALERKIREKTGFVVKLVKSD